VKRKEAADGRKYFRYENSPHKQRGNSLSPVCGLRAVNHFEKYTRTKETVQALPPNS